MEKDCYFDYSDGVALRFWSNQIFNQWLGSSVITNWGFTADKLCPPNERSWLWLLDDVGRLDWSTDFGIWTAQSGLSLIILQVLFPSARFTRADD